MTDIHLLSPLTVGGQVKISRKGVPRVVWERKKRSDDPDVPPTVDFIPFLSVSRSLGDFWSWSERTQQFVVSPQPDVHVHTLDPTQQRFLLLASDGLWNVMSPQDVVNFVWDYESRDKDDTLLHQGRDVVRALIDEALYRWRKKGMFADNISVVIAFLSQDGSHSSLCPSFTSCSQSIENNTTSNEVTSEPAAAIPDVVHHVHNTHTGSTVYHKETLPGGALIEEHTVISLRCRRKDKLRAKAEVNEARVEREGMEGGERSPIKRVRDNDPEEEINQPPPEKKRRQERDSGCESDSGSPMTEQPRQVTASFPEEPPSSSGVCGEDHPPNHSPSSPAPTEAALTRLVVILCTCSGGMLH